MEEPVNKKEPTDRELMLRSVAVLHKVLRARILGGTRAQSEKIQRACTELDQLKHHLDDDDMLSFLSVYSQLPDLTKLVKPLEGEEREEALLIKSRVAEVLNSIKRSVIRITETVSKNFDYHKTNAERLRKERDQSPSPPPVKVVKDFYCTKCSYRSHSKSNLKLHVMRHVPNEERAYGCPYCTSRFQWPSRLKRHMQKLHSLE